MNQIRIEEKARAFQLAMSDLYNDPEHRNPENYIKLDAEDGQDMTEDFLAMIIAMYYLYRMFSDGGKEDLLGFTHLLNRIAVNYLLEPDAKEKEENADDEG